MGVASGPSSAQPVLRDRARSVALRQRILVGVDGTHAGGARLPSSILAPAAARARRVASAISGPMPSPADQERAGGRRASVMVAGSRLRQVVPYSLHLVVDRARGCDRKAAAPPWWASRRLGERVASGRAFDAHGWRPRRSRFRRTPSAWHLGTRRPRRHRRRCAARAPAGCHSGADLARSSERMAARDSTFSSSRMLPGQW